MVDVDVTAHYLLENSVKTVGNSLNQLNSTHSTLIAILNLSVFGYIYLKNVKEKKTLYLDDDVIMK